MVSEFSKKEEKMSKFGVGLVLEVRMSNVYEFGGERLKFALCEWNGLGDYKGLVMMRVHADGSMTEYGQARSVGHVKKLWQVLTRGC